jgi:hypothetical protein
MILAMFDCNPIISAPRRETSAAAEHEYLGGVRMQPTEYKSLLRITKWLASLTILIVPMAVAADVVAE